MSKHTKIYTGTSIIINRLAFLLHLINIPSLIKNRKESGRLAGFGALDNSVELFVHHTDIKKASSVLEDLRKRSL